MVMRVVQSLVSPVDCLPEVHFHQLGPEIQNRNPVGQWFVITAIRRAISSQSVPIGSPSTPVIAVSHDQKRGIQAL